MLTTDQIRDAYELLGWTVEDMIRAAFMLPSVVERVRANMRDGILDFGQQIAIRRAFEGQGVALTRDGSQVRRDHA